MLIFKLYFHYNPAFIILQQHFLWVVFIALPHVRMRDLFFAGYMIEW